MSISYSNHAFPYRAEIDGLRALAVIPVVLFHAGVKSFSGGFVGVDVFFVISGYLITLIISREIAEGKFSMAAFYERRIRRLFPALIVMFFCCLAAASLLLMPQDLRGFARSMVASVAFSSNIVFWAEGGYFDSSADLKPLLHTWSLSVEEQFYIVFPPLLLWLMTKVQRWKAVLGSIFICSLALCIIYTRTNPNTAFYLPIFRMWELLLGSFIALSIGFRKLENRAIRSSLSGLGVVLICAAIFAFDSTTDFPGALALLPCMGAALIIAYSRGSVVSTILGSAPLAWVGQISYSLYLWHWPVIVFFKYYTMRELNEREQLLVVAMSLAAAFISMRFIETPFRHKKFAYDRRRLFSMAGATIGILLVASFSTYLAKGFPNRLPDEVQRMASGATDVNPERKRCDSRGIRDVEAGNVCTIGAPETKPTFAILGDSFGDALVPGIAAAAIDSNKQGIVLTSSGCYPLQGVIDLNKRGDTTCEKFVAASLELIRKTPSITDVILIGRWTTAALGTRFGSTTAKDWFIKDAHSHETGYQENQRVFNRALARTVGLLHEKRVHIVSYIPEQHIDPPRTLALCKYFDRTCPQGILITEYEKRQEFVRRAIVQLSGKKNLHVIDVGKKLCVHSSCDMVAGGIMLYSDDNHLSRAGALYIKDLFLPVFSH